MADTFTPRGAPVPSNSYDGWELTHRPAMLPFLAEYTNPQGETAGGWAMPNMVTEPVNALFRLMNTPTGTMPDPRDSQNQSDALTGLMALYGGNALGGVARNAMSRGVARGLDMEAARPVAYSNAIDEAMSNPNMLSMMRDIDYANLNRRALDQYGVGYEGLNSSQEAALRGWSDPATLMSDTGKPNPVGAAVSGHGLPMDQAARMARAKEMGFDTDATWYHGTRAGEFSEFDPSRANSSSQTGVPDGAMVFTSSPENASTYAATKQGMWGDQISYEPGASVIPVMLDGRTLDMVVDAKGANWRDIQYNGQFYDANELAQIAKDLEYEGLLIRNVVDSKISAGAKPADTYFKFSPEGIRSVNAAFDPAKADSSFLLASDTGKPSLLGAALAGYDPNWPFNK